MGSAGERKQPSKGKSRRPQSVPPGGGRMKAVLKIYNASFKEVATFALAQRAAAEKEAARLTEATGHHHFVNTVKVPFDEE